MTMSSPARLGRCAASSIDRRVGIVLGRARDRDPARRDEAGEIVDMAVGMVVEQAVAEPDAPARSRGRPAAALRPRRAVRRDCGWG